MHVWGCNNMMQHTDVTSTSIISSSAVAVVIWKWAGLPGKGNTLWNQFSAEEIDKLLRMQDRKRHKVEAANVKLCSV